MAWIATALSVCKLCYIVIFSVRLCTSQPYCKKKDKQMMSKITQALCHMIDPLISYYLRRTVKVVFIFVGLCVCLFVSNITEKCVNGVPWNFQGRWNLVQVTIWNPLSLLVSVSHTNVHADLHPANERRRYFCNDVSHWLGANIELFRNINKYTYMCCETWFWIKHYSG